MAMKRRSFFGAIAAALGIGAAATQRTAIATLGRIEGPRILPPPPHLDTRLFIDGVEIKGLTCVSGPVLEWREIYS